MMTGTTVKFKEKYQMMLLNSTTLKKTLITEAVNMNTVEM